MNKSYILITSFLGMTLSIASIAENRSSLDMLQRHPQLMGRLMGRQIQPPYNSVWEFVTTNSVTINNNLSVSIYVDDYRVGLNASDPNPGSTKYAYYYGELSYDPVTVSGPSVISGQSVQASFQFNTSNLALQYGDSFNLGDIAVFATCQTDGQEWIQSSGTYIQQFPDGTRQRGTSQVNQAFGICSIKWGDSVYNDVEAYLTEGHDNILETSHK